MRATRRTFLNLTTAAGAAALAGGLQGCSADEDSGAAGDSGGTGEGPAPDREPEPAALWDPGATSAEVFPFGVQSGDPTPSGVLLSVRSRGVSAVQFVLVRAQDGAWVEDQTVPSVTTNDEGVAQVEVMGLLADTAYCYAARSDNGVWSRVGRFRTALDETGWRKVVFGATSCMGGNEPQTNMTQALADRLDFFCWLGDTVYCDGSVTLEDFRQQWQEGFRIRGLQDALAGTGAITTWDDHELTDNSRIDNLPAEARAAGIQAFQEAMPWRPGAGPAPSLWRVLRWGAVLDVFVLDCRGEREGSNYISRQQMDWLKQELSQSTARFKIILNTVPITDETPLWGQAEIEDRWQGFPEQRSEILGHISDQGIAGVLWISGDHHFPMVARVDPAGGVADDQWEVLVGPGGTWLNPIADLVVDPPEQFPLIFAAHNYGRFTCDPSLGTILVEFVGNGGELLESMTLEV